MGEEVDRDPKADRFRVRHGIHRIRRGPTRTPEGTPGEGWEGAGVRRWGGPGEGPSPFLLPPDVPSLLGQTTPAMPRQGVPGLDPSKDLVDVQPGEGLQQGIEANARGGHGVAKSLPLGMSWDAQRPIGEDLARLDADGGGHVRHDVLGLLPGPSRPPQKG